MDGTLTGFRKMYVKLTKLLRSKERSSNRVTQKNPNSVYRKSSNKRRLLDGLKGFFQI